MACPQIASITPTAVASSTSHVISMPSTRPDGDLYLFVANGSGTNGTWTAPAGWTAYSSNPINETGSNTNQLRLWWRTGSSEPATYTVTLGSARVAAWVVLRITGANNSSPIGTVTSLIETVVGGVLCPGATPTQNDSLLLYVAGTSVSAVNDRYVSPTSINNITLDVSLPAGTTTSGTCLGIKATVAPVSGIASTVFHFPNGGGTSQNIGLTVCVKSSSPRTSLPSYRKARSGTGGGSYAALPLVNSITRPTTWPGQIHTASSYWNNKASLLTASSQSASLCTTLWNSATPAGHFLFFDRNFTYAEYFVQNATTTYTVSCTYGNMKGRQIAWNPTWTIPAQGVNGADAQFILLDLSTGEEWNGWQVTKNDATKVLTCTRCNRLDSTADDSTYGTAVDFRTHNGNFYPSRGGGNAYSAMLLMPEHFHRGVIPFALPMVIPATACNKTAFVAPAIKNGDGTGTAAVPSTIPYGQRFGLDPTKFTNSYILSLCDRIPNDIPNPVAMSSALRVLATAARDYGMIVCDTGGAVHIQTEADESAGPIWTALGLNPVTTSVTGKRFPDHLFDLILAGSTSANLVAYA